MIKFTNFLYTNVVSFLFQLLAVLLFMAAYLAVGMILFGIIYMIYLGMFHEFYLVYIAFGVLFLLSLLAVRDLKRSLRRSYENGTANKISRFFYIHLFNRKELIQKYERLF